MPPPMSPLSHRPLPSLQHPVSSPPLFISSAFSPYLVSRLLPLPLPQHPPTLWHQPPFGAPWHQPPFGAPSVPVFSPLFGIGPFRPRCPSPSFGNVQPYLAERRAFHSVLLLAERRTFIRSSLSSRTKAKITFVWPNRIEQRPYVRSCFAELRAGAWGDSAEEGKGDGERADAEKWKDAEKGKKIGMMLGRRDIEKVDKMKRKREEMGRRRRGGW